ncbi:MAG: DUF790 family protein [Myxococcales bacterium]|nr:DUF790 family protein [Myxococcales bacterium]
MLTRDLVLFSVRNARVRPRFLARKDAQLQSVVAALVESHQTAVGQSLEAVEETMAVEVSRYRYPKVVRGLVKLLTDALTVEDPGDAAINLRRETFRAAMDVLKAVNGELTPEAYAKKVADEVGQDVSSLRQQLYADRPQRRLVTAVEEMDREGLMNRYDLALAQGLVMYSQRLSLQFPDLDRPEVRRMLRFMRFCRLVAKVERTKTACRLLVEGPAAIFEGSKGYGLQLASFLTVVPSLPEWSLHAEVHWPRRASAELILTPKDGLQPRVWGGAGYVPEEMRSVLNKIDEPGWSVDVAPAPEPVGATGLAVPDFALIPERGPTLKVELFHRYHRGALTRRLDELAMVPDPHYRLGVDRALVTQDAELSSRAKAHPQVFFFRSFPSRRIIRSLMVSEATS